MGVGHEQQSILGLQRKMFRKRKTRKVRGKWGLGGLCLVFLKDSFPSCRGVICLLELCVHTR